MQLPVELQQEVLNLVEQTKDRSGWPIQRTLEILEFSPASYYRWRRSLGGEQSAPRSGNGTMYELLPSERQAIIDYALQHPQIRHRELAWRMLDEGICAVSAASVYRVLREADLVCRWKPRVRVKPSERPERPSAADQLWQTDIRYVKVGARNYYLLSFLDVYSRYVVYHELLSCMDGLSVSIAAAAALATLAGNRTPAIQSDHGSGFIAHEFAGTLAAFGVSHVLIRPHTPTDNGIIERYHRTIGEQIDVCELDDFTDAKRVIADIIAQYNNERLHATLSYLRPIDYYRGNPEVLLAERRRRLETARELRKQENINLRQRQLPWRAEPSLN